MITNQEMNDVKHYCLNERESRKKVIKNSRKGVSWLVNGNNPTGESNGCRAECARSIGTILGKVRRWTDARVTTNHEVDDVEHY